MIRVIRSDMMMDLRSSGRGASAALAVAVALVSISVTARTDAAGPSKKKRVLVELYTSQG